MGPACVFDHDSRNAMTSLIRKGYCDCLFAGNALATHDLEEALLHVAREPVKTFGSGRTDAGVHARGQVVHCDISKPIPPPNLRRALNARLPEDIRVMRVKIVADDFDARLVELTAGTVVSEETGETFRGVRIR